ncbi:MAG TPA: trypsin-like peptidase domain-containing protein [Gemmatimonadaceae bacterium]|nr:trypsin-like peptidase domain-containing protein [Gemmatimonadaceae bacterium]
MSSEGNGGATGDRPRVRVRMKNEDAMNGGTVTDQPSRRTVTREVRPGGTPRRTAATAEAGEGLAQALEQFVSRQQEAPARADQDEAAAKRFAERQAERTERLALLHEGKFLAADTERRVVDRAVYEVEMREGRAPTAIEVSELTRRVRVARESEVAIGVAGEATEEQLETPRAAIERIIATNDLQPVNYLPRGVAASRAIGRVVVQGGQWYGTGFMVTPSLLMTNNHVLENAEAAEGSAIEFNYQLGIDGKDEQRVTLSLDPGKFFVTDAALDFSVVAVGGTVAQRKAFGYHKLIEKEGKIIAGEPVTIVQHPQAERKQISLRENRVFDVLPNFLHYETDTEPGSSGSPVFNDMWQVVALHHAGVPKTGKNGKVEWVANEGVRISRIVAHLRKQSFSGERGRLLKELLEVPVYRPTEVTGAGSSSGATDDDPSRDRTSAAPVSAGAMPLVLQVDSPPQRVTITIGQGGTASITPTPGLTLPVGPGVGPVRAVEAADSIPTGNLTPGDVLLYRGTGIISKGIQWFDSSEVSHAGLYLGGLRVGEALANGLETRSLRDSFREQEWVAARRLTALPGNMTPVLGLANRYLAQRVAYGYSQIVLLAILSLVRKLAPTGWTGWLIVAAAKAALAALSAFLQSTRDLMICSEFVYRCYDEADPARQDQYTIRIVDLPFEAAPGSGELEAAKASLRRGRGVHPESVLAGLVREPGRVAEAMRQAPASLETMPSPGQQEQLEARVEDLLLRYIEEVRTGKTSPRMERLGSQDELEQELATVVGQFAVALTAADSVRAGKHRSADEALAAAAQENLGNVLPPSLAHLFRTAADFVTPGDLFKTQSLVTLGKVTGV